MADLTFGSSYSLPDSAEYPDLAICKLSADKYVIIYKGTSQYCRAVIATVSGDIVSYGTEITINAAESQDLRVCRMADDKFCVSYIDVGNSSYLNAKVCTVSGSTITAGSETTIRNTACINFNVICPNTDKLIFIHRTNSNTQISNYIYTVSGTTLTYGNDFNVTSTGNGADAAVIDTDKVAVSWFDTSSDALKASVITISGTTPTVGTEVQISANSTKHTRIDKIDTNKFIITRSRDDGNSNGAAVICTVSGTTITAGSEYQFSVTPATNVNIGVYDASTAVIIYEDYSDSNKLRSIVASISGTVITYGNEVSYYEATTTGKTNGKTVAPTSTGFIFVYQQSTNFYGFSIVGQLPQTPSFIPKIIII